ncbi:LAMI_0A01178g1_1 [Lachancea mirantina]|uniref:Actin-binding protein n=1 Tax=Lachancea mirantina TaxID=1230905 RepID=A0A1G4ILM3_9SACH|nr:LAMI_0A01178g1_1 [Lachancea mirantina]
MALEPIDCTTHSREIQDAYLDVVRGSDPDTTWLVLSPNAQKQYAPEFTGSDFTQFLETFADSKVQFGLARVSPPGSDVKKLLLIGWCPDSAPMKTRASFAANFGTVANQVLKGYHVQVTARDEDDLDEKELLGKISNATGARYSIQQPTQPTKTASAARPKAAAAPQARAAAQKDVPAPTPAASTPAAPAKRHDDNDDDEDWGEPELEERDFRSKPLKPNKSSYTPMGKIDLQKVIAEETAKPDPRLFSAAQSETITKSTPQEDIDRLKQESKAKRDYEYSKLMGTRPPNLDATRSGNDDKVIKGFKTEKSPAQLWAERKQNAAKTEPESKTTAPADPNTLAAEVESDKKNDHDQVADIKKRFENMATADDTPIIQPRPVEKAPAAKPVASMPPPPTRTKAGIPLPGMHTEAPTDEPADDDESWDDEDDDAAGPGSIPKPPARTAAPSAPMRAPATSEHVTKFEAPAADEEEQEPQPPLPSRKSEVLEPQTTEPEEEEEDEEEDVPQPPPRSTQTANEPPAPLPTRTQESSPAPPPPPRRVSPAPAPASEKPKTPSATAEYDYDAAENNELTFAEGDKIINIEFVDEDWWLGELVKSGEKGLFPSNYVELDQ